MNKIGAALVLFGIAGAVYAGRSRVVTAGGSIEPNPDDFYLQLPPLDLGVFTPTDTNEAHNMETPQAQANLSAFLKTIHHSEGTGQGGRNPYATVYAYKFTITDFSDHPANLGWRGVQLSDQMCSLAGFGSGCVSTAAGAYQITKTTWNRLKKKLGLVDFSKASQDAAALELIRERGALADVMAGRFDQAVSKCRKEWASLPGAGYGQGEKSLAALQSAYASAGGQFA